MRVMAYNIEWFDDHFESDNRLKNTQDAQNKFTSVSSVISTIDPDIVGITEAPNTTTTTGQRSTVTALENFASQHGLRQNKALIGFPSPGRQEIAILYDPNVVSATHDPGGSAGKVRNPRFDEPFQADSNGDKIFELYKHYRPPLKSKLSGRMVVMISGYLSYTPNPKVYSARWTASISTESLKETEENFLPSVNPYGNEWRNG
ncbi:MAG: hypothetical protein AB2603_14560 [Candidatus Thiodiazotropha endolucinida]